MSRFDEQITAVATPVALAGDAAPNEHFAARLIDAVLTMAGPRFQSTDHISRH
jgi:hypothetical protein